MLCGGPILVLLSVAPHTEELFKRLSWFFSCRSSWWRHICFNENPVALSFKCQSGKCVNTSTFHSRIWRVWGVLFTCNTAWREDCMIPLPEFRLVCNSKSCFAKKLKMWDLICLVVFLCLSLNSLSVYTHTCTWHTSSKFLLGQLVNVSTRWGHATVWEPFPNISMQVV